MSDPLTDVLSRLKKVRPEGNGHQACCPAHSDGTPSLSINTGTDGRILLHCHAGCSSDAVMSAMGLTARDLFPQSGSRSGSVAVQRPAPISKPPQSSSKIFPTAELAIQAWVNSLGAFDARYEYTDAAGETVQVILRWDAGKVGKKKELRPVSRCKGGWHKKALTSSRPLYRLGELVRHPEKVVAIHEGEKAVDAVIGVNAFDDTGMIPVTWSGGCDAINKTDWQPLAGRTVWIFPDNDKPGEDAARKIQKLLAELSPAPTTEVCKLHDLVGVGDDAADIVERFERAGAGTELTDALRNYEVIDLGDGVPPFGIKCIDDVESRPIEWLWEKRFAIGKQSNIDGDPGLGKSTVTLDFAARISKGRNWPDGSQCPQGNVLIISCEDSAEDTIKPRLDAAGANHRNIYILDAELSPDFTLQDVGRIEATVKQIPGLVAVIIDPVTAFLGRTDSHKNAEVRAMLSPLVQLADKYRFALINVNHLRKGEGAAIYRSLGSIGFAANARAVYAVAKDRNDPTGQRRLLLPCKNNIGDDRTGFAYRLMNVDGCEQPVVAWEPEPVTIAIDDALAQPKPKTDADHAADWLREYLDDRSLPAKEVIAAGADAGDWSERTLRAGLKRAGGRSKQGDFGGVYFWSIPSPSFAPPEEVQSVQSMQSVDGTGEKRGFDDGITQCDLGGPTHGSNGKPHSEPMLPSFAQTAHSTGGAFRDVHGGAA